MGLQEGAMHKLSQRPADRVAEQAPGGPQERTSLWQPMVVVWVLSLAVGSFGASLAQASGPLSRVNHIIIVMQENHSFDNYFGVLPYAVGTPYTRGPCDSDEHRCVDGLSCARSPGTEAYHCRNFNRDEDHKKVFAFHSRDYCVHTDLNH